VDESPQVAANSPDTARAEELLGQMTDQVGTWSSKLSFQFLKGVARVREEAEDIWAEAQSLHRTGRPPDKGPTA